jgi:hypothetical protein
MTDDYSPKFCTRCKRELVDVSTPTHYDAYTGDLVYKITLVCPKTRGISSLWNLDHDEWEFTEGFWLKISDF